jgi:hypothetical protein
MLAEKRLAVPVSLTQARMVFNIWNACVYLMENLFVLRLIVLEETSSLPKGVARLAERPWLQTGFGVMNVSTTTPPPCPRATEHTPLLKMLHDGPSTRRKIAGGR